MKQTNHQTFITWIEAQIEAHRSACQQLINDDRGDEAVFEKVRMNICDIFKTVMNAGLKAVGEDEKALGAFFRGRIEQIPGSWRTSLQNALRSGDTEKAHLEQIKLETAGEIEKVFVQIWEENT